MDNYYVIMTTNLQESVSIWKAKKADVMNNFCNSIVNKYNKEKPGSRLHPNEIVSVINIRTHRVLRMSGKVWDQLGTGDGVWLVTNKEWQHYSDTVLQHQGCRVRHGRRLPCRTPSVLSSVQLQQMVESKFTKEMLEQQHLMIFPPKVPKSPPKPKTPAIFRDRFIGHQEQKTVEVSENNDLSDKTLQDNSFELLQSPLLVTESTPSHFATSSQDDNILATPSLPTKFLDITPQLKETPKPTQESSDQSTSVEENKSTITIENEHSENQQAANAAMLATSGTDDDVDPEAGEGAVADNFHQQAANAAMLATSNTDDDVDPVAAVAQSGLNGTDTDWYLSDAYEGSTAYVSENLDPVCPSRNEENNGLDNETIEKSRESELDCRSRFVPAPAINADNVAAKILSPNSPEKEIKNQFLLPAKITEKSAPVNITINVELQRRLVEKVEELEEEKRAKAKLEARLDETRSLLKLFAAANSARGQISSKSNILDTDSDNYIDLDALEDTLKDVSVDAMLRQLEISKNNRNESPGQYTSQMKRMLRRLAERRQEQRRRRDSKNRSSDSSEFFVAVNNSGKKSDVRPNQSCSVVKERKRIVKTRHDKSYSNKVARNRSSVLAVTGSPNESHSLSSVDSPQPASVTGGQNYTSVSDNHSKKSELTPVISLHLPELEAASGEGSRLIEEEFEEAPIVEFKGSDADPLSDADPPPPPPITTTSEVNGVSGLTPGSTMSGHRGTLSSEQKLLANSVGRNQSTLQERNSINLSESLEMMLTSAEDEVSSPQDGRNDENHTGIPQPNQSFISVGSGRDQNEDADSSDISSVSSLNGALINRDITRRLGASKDLTSISPAKPPLVKPSIIINNNFGPCVMNESDCKTMDDLHEDEEVRELLKDASTTVLKSESKDGYHYDYDTYHTQHPELFIDSAPNSPYVGYSSGNSTDAKGKLMVMLNKQENSPDVEKVRPLLPPKVFFSDEKSAVMDAIIAEGNGHSSDVPVESYEANEEQSDNLKAFNRANSPSVNSNRSVIFDEGELRRQEQFATAIENAFIKQSDSCSPGQYNVPTEIGTMRDDETSELSPASLSALNASVDITPREEFESAETSQPSSTGNVHSIGDQIIAKENSNSIDLQMQLENEIRLQEEQAQLLKLKLEQEKMELELEKLKQMRQDMLHQKPISVIPEEHERHEAHADHSIRRHTVACTPEADDLLQKNITSSIINHAKVEVNETESATVHSSLLSPQEEDFSGDVMGSLLLYYRVFLATNLYLAGPASFRGAAARSHLIRGKTRERNVINFCVFQQYGSVEGAAVRGIKTIQVIRALKDAGICGAITASQLDLLLTKINSRSATETVITPKSSGLLKKPPIGGRNQTSISKTGTITKALPGSAGKSDTVMLASDFPTFEELLVALATKIFAKEPKVRQRVARKGIVLGDFTNDESDLYHQHRSGNTQNEELIECLEKMNQAWRGLLSKKDQTDYQIMLLESKMSCSGMLLKSHYRRIAPSIPVSGDPHPSLLEKIQPSGSSLKKIRNLQLPDSELDLMRHVWDRNSDQIRQIYWFYAKSLGVRRCGNGPMPLLISFDSCREFLADFHVLPHVIDAHSFLRLFRVCKLWEYEVVDQLLLAEQSANFSSASIDHGDGNAAAVKHSPSDGQSLISGSINGTGNGDTLDVKAALGNLDLTLNGFMELLSRVALHRGKLGPRPHQALENLLRIMDASGGKAKLIKSSRKSISVRHFVYGKK